MKIKKSFQTIDPALKIGILGGGQLGRMLCQAAADWDLNTYTLDADSSFPAALVSRHFLQGDFRNEADVYNFGKEMNVLTIEIEDVNIEALDRLELEGVEIHPRPGALRLIRDKILQKEFYREHLLPTADFQTFENSESIINAVSNQLISLPFVQKTAVGGYDGHGVSVIHSVEDLARLLPGRCLVEPLVNIQKEIAVIAARNPSGEITCFPAVEMEFHPTANLVEFLSCPASLTEEQSREAEVLARKTIRAFDICGVLAVEMFLDESGKILINEVAPRPHNSGHQTIECCYTSQYQQHLRAILNLPLGSTELIQPAVMLNVLGAEGHAGPVYYEGADEILQEQGVYLHLYGKAETRPFRKMGHITVMAKELDKAREIGKRVGKRLRVISKTDQSA